ncbi:hypothetical protein J19TS2_34700 [Cohnella xylanilytica]|uniref:bifunctional adenosylcobinamide kinase/adenosylcobinamide-phosphate guanylyltransferase n=1 Tax=Cohnella xylanilytica TaxID=557555 RepID=UPI001B0D7E1B|nr:bifunctional adenosylcobinamide kinase/adenosylcobinamide-phosphate guanylyltransferase [Cohnella xylanilytica]GIO13915.1 hypothetical protein J19TS2_34700 [Cohnella xylanilytica]
MLWLVTGGVGSGKSAFAERWAAAHGREAIKLACPAWPNGNGRFEDEIAVSEENAKAANWTTAPADHGLAERLRRINLRSNPFRASSRVVVVDSLSGWLRREVEETRKLFPRAEAPSPPRRGRRRKPVETEEVFLRRAALLEKALGEVVEELLSFDGSRIVVTEEAAAGLADDPWERWYVRQLAYANRRLGEASDGIHRLSFGIATEIKGTMIRERGTNRDENLYPNRG